MMHIGSGKRDEWEFEYTAAKLAEGAKAQREFRLGRVAWWTDAKAKVMAEVKETGLEVNESMAASLSNYANTSIAASLSNYANTSIAAPQISVRADLQKKLGECHSKIQSHQQAADEYEGWVQVLGANAESRLKLTQADWLYFFGKR